MSSDRLSRPKLNLTCYFWAEGRCNKSDEDCGYQHRHTNRIALPPKTHRYQESLTKTPASDPRLENQHAHTDRITPPARPQRHQESYTKTPVSVPKSQNEEITCYNWHHSGQCNLSDGDCPYVHWHTGKVSLHPGSIPKSTTGEQWHLANVPSASPVVPRLSRDEKLAIEKCAQDFDQQRQQAGEGKLQYNKTAEFLLNNNETVSTRTPARLGSHSAVDPGRTLLFQPNQQNYSTYFPRPVSPALFSTSPNNPSIVRTRESAPMSRDKEAQAAPVHHLGPERTRGRRRLSSDELYRRTFRDDSRTRRHAPYDINRARAARPVTTFEREDLHGRSSHRSQERIHPEVERFFGQSNLSQSVPEPPRQPPVRQPTSASHRSPSTQQVFRRPPQQSSFDVMIDRMVAMLAQEDIRVTHAQVRETLRRGPSRQSSFDTMIDRMVEMLAEEGFRVTHAQVQDLVLRLQQPTISPASVTMEEDTAERLESRHLRRFR